MAGRQPSVVLGGKGMLGADLVAAIEADGTFAPAVVGDLPEVDITREDSIGSFLEAKEPRFVFNCAAYTNVDGCESHRDEAFAVNATGAGNAAAAAARVGARLIHVSTDFVFDGALRRPYEETDPPAPLSVYGKSKLAGEAAVAERGKQWAIARTAWLYGGHSGRNFVDLMLRLCREKDELKVVTDQVGSPTWSADLARALIAMVKRGVEGVFHAANDGACTRFEWVERIVEYAGLSTRLVPADSAAFPRPAPVPAYSALSTAKLRRETGWQPEYSFEDTLATVLDDWRERVRVTQS